MATQLLRVSSGLRLPSELVAMILEVVRARRDTLATCSLICKSWACLAQKHIFHSITIDTETKLCKLHAFLSTSQHLAVHIRILVIKPYHQRLAALGWEEMQDWIGEIPGYLATLLLNVHTMHFQHVDQGLAAIDPQFSNFARLRTLKLTSCDFSRFDDFEQLVFKFPQVKNLALDMVSWPEPPQKRYGGVSNTQEQLVRFGVAHNPQRSHLRLHSLQVGRFCRMRLLVPWISDTASCRSLKELALPTVEPEQLPEAGALLLRLGSSLQHLTLGCKFDRNIRAQSFLGNYLQLSANSGLRSLRIRLLDLSNEKMQWVPWLLEDIDTTSLRWLQFDIWLWNGFQLRAPHWNEIEHILNSARYGSLDGVTFVQRTNVDCEGPLDINGARIVIQRRFPKLSERGILHVEDGRDVVSES